MQVKTVFGALGYNRYPGRGILIGKSADGKCALAAYFIMGRSENSRNRVFVPDADGIRTKAFDPDKLTDPSLVIYRPVRFFKNHIIVTNGDQTDTVYEFLKQGKTFADALQTRTFEPDAPNYTPRVSGLVTLSDGGFSFRLSILKSAGGNPESAQRFFFDYPQPVSGIGRLIHTYRGDGNPIPSFEGEPAAVMLPSDPHDLADTLWDSLNRENRVSLYVYSAPLAGGEGTTVIINKHGEDHHAQ